MKLWDFCKGNEHRAHLELGPWRVVEAQHISSSRDLVETSEEHDLLEELLEEAKPAILSQKHYLIFTPFRYPPLRYGSRFGSPYEPSLWYGSLELVTAFAEVAYYRFLFFKDSAADLGYIEIPLSAFKAFIKTSNGIDLSKPPFGAHQEKISDKKNYGHSQALGADMREAGIEAFIFVSARCKDFKKNVGVYTPQIFIKKKEQYIADMQNWRCLANQNAIEFSRYDFTKKEVCAFLHKDFE